MEKKIIDWLNSGLIDDSTAKKLLLDVRMDKERLRKTRANITIYTIAIILIGLGVITFISANSWILMLLNNCYFLKILLMVLVTTGSFWGGYKLAYENKKYPKLGHALIFLSCILIGATYALIGQIYNINANSSALLFIWLLSILPLAFIFKNFAINILSIILYILSVIFFYGDLNIDKSLTWTIFIPIFIGISLYSFGNIPYILNKFNNFSLSYKLTGATPVFITLLILTCSSENSYQMTSPYYIVPILLLAVLNVYNRSNINKTDVLKIETEAVFCFIGLLLLMLLLPNVYEGLVMIIANLLIIAMIVFGFNQGYKYENSNIIALTNWLLTIYLTVNYFRWGWSLMDKSFFFIFGGAALLSLGLFLENKRKEVVKEGK